MKKLVVAILVGVVLGALAVPTFAGSKSVKPLEHGNIGGIGVMESGNIGGIR